MLVLVRQVGVSRTILRNCDTVHNNSNANTRDLIKESVISCSQVDFSQQSLLLMIEHEEHNKTLQTDLSDLANHVNAMVCVERNAKHQMYLLQDLH